MTLNQRVCQCVARRCCQGGCRCADIAVLPPSRIREDFRPTVISIVKDVSPPNWRWFLMCRYPSLATVIEEVAAQSCHCNLAAVKNSRRLPTRRHCHRQGCCAAISKEIADAPTLQSHHRCWGGFYTVLSLLSHRCQEFEENKRFGRSRQQPIQQTDFRHKQEGVTNKKLTQGVQTEEVQIGRHDKQHIANTGE